MPESNHEFAHAKLTRTLRVLGLRADGYHAISSEMVALELADELEFTDGEGLDLVDAIEWTGDRPIVLSSVIAPGRNLVDRALALVGRKSHIRLTKRIPPGAGLGGGSSDAAAVLRWAGEDDTAVAARLGADVPFCLRGGHANVSGVGEILEPLPPIIVSFVLLIPAIGVSTASVYSAFDESGRANHLDGANDLEEAALIVEPRLARYRDLLRDVSARAPLLAGSGSTWFVECAPRDARPIQDNVRAAVHEDDLTAAVLATQTAT